VCNITICLCVAKRATQSQYLPFLLKNPPTSISIFLKRIFFSPDLFCSFTNVQAKFKKKKGVHLFDGFSFPAPLCTFSENVFFIYFNFIFFLYDWHELGEMRQPKKLPASWFDLIQNKIKKKLKLLSALTSTHTQQSKGSRSQTKVQDIEKYISIWKRQSRDVSVSIKKAQCHSPGRGSLIAVQPR
jgi:hypothetical protein